MYPNLRFAFYDVFGVDLPFLGLVQSFGFCLAMAFLVAGWWLSADLKRREQEGLLQGKEETFKVGEPLSAQDIIWSLFLGFMIGFKGVYAAMHVEAFSGDNARANLFSLEHGNWIAGIVLALAFAGWKYFEKKKESEKYPQPQVITELVMPHQRVGDIVILSAISGVFGAKMLYLAEIPTSEWADALMSGSGLTIYGGLIFAFFVVSYYVRSKGISYSNLVDAAAPSLILAYGVGRLGCHFSGDGDWGDPNPNPELLSWLPDWLWAYSYPNNVLSQGQALADCGGYPFGADYGYCMELPARVYPTPTWEFLMSTIIFFILVRLRRWARQGGLLFCIYLIFNGLERFTIEIIRVNSDFQIFGFSLTQAQMIAIVLFTIGLIGTGILYYQQLKSDKQAA
jgi:phosphatidylglycerol:prolipoprotein diacylglycerol transferase